MHGRHFTVKDRMKILPETDIERIHYGALDVLERTGILFDDPEALQILEDAGCEVDSDKKLVKFPPGLVEDCIRKVPSSFTIRARDPKNDQRVGGRNVYFATFPAVNMRDLETGERRLSTVKDVGELATIVDALDNIHSPFFPVAVIADKPPKLCMEWILAELIRHSTKAQHGASFFGSPKWHVEIAKATNQVILGSVAPVPPLTYPKEMVDGLLTYSRAGFPVEINAALAMGATGPVTLAGALVQHHAENMAGIVLVQLVRPGNPVACGSYTQVMDMRYGTLAPGAIENGLIAAALSQIYHHFDIPVWMFFPLTDSKLPDAQAAYEKAMQLMLCAMSGVNYISFAGGTEDEQCFSAAQLIIDNEMAGMMGRVLQGIDVTDETLAIDLIHEIGPLPGSFLGTEHTRNLWKTAEIYKPTLSDRLTWEKWRDKGSKDIATVAWEKAREILKTHEPTPLPEEVDAELDRILEAAAKEKLG
jgi:trimethylamine--corrinoid protein Co-methyltransferase